MFLVREELRTLLLDVYEVYQYPQRYQGRVEWSMVAYKLSSFTAIIAGRAARYVHNHGVDSSRRYRGGKLAPTCGLWGCGVRPPN